MRGRLTALMLLLFSVGAVVLYVAAGTYARLAADHSYDRLLSGAALSIAETVSITGDKVMADIPYAALDMLSAAPEDRVFYQVVGPDGRTVTGYPDLPRLKVGPMAHERAPHQAQFFDADYRGEKVRFATLSREIMRPGSSGWVWVQVGQTRRARRGLADELVLAALAPIAVFSVLALVAVRFGIDRALRPLNLLGAELSGRAPSELHPVTTPVPAEMAPVIQALDGFMRRLDDNTAKLRGFIADTAHQMRTPLAGLLAQAQLAPHDEPAELRRSLKRIEASATKMTRLLNQLLSEATVHHRSELGVLECFDLAKVVRRAARDAVPSFEDADIRVRTRSGPAEYRGDAFMLGEALKNLIHNAWSHGGGGDAPVRVELSATEDGYLVTVADQGPGISDAEKEKVFERFACGAGAPGGAGLGLAIARRAVERHGGSITLGDRPSGGLLVSIHLPSYA